MQVCFRLVPRGIRACAFFAALLMFGATLVASSASAQEVAFKWQDGLPMPVALSNPAVIAHEGLIYVLGGYVKKEGASSASFVYDPTRRSWSSLPSMLSPRFGHAVAFVEKEMIVLGGVREVGGNQAFVRTIEAFDPESRKWRIAGEMPGGRARFGLVVFGGRLFLVGGTTETERATARVDTWDPASNLWEKWDPLPQPRTRLAAATVGGRLIAGGGEDAAGRTLSSFLEFDTATSRWVSLASMSAPRKNFALARLGPRLVAAGGWEEDGREKTFPKSTELFDPVRNTWAPASLLEPGRDGARAVTVAGTVYLVGGHDGDEPLPLLSEGRWVTSKSRWRPDEGMRIHLASFRNADDRELDTVNSEGVRSLGLSGDGQPDITNINLREITNLGFPLPRPADAVRLKLYLKFFEYPATLDAVLSVHRVFDPLLIFHCGGGSAIVRTLAERGRVIVKKAIIAPVQQAFGPLRPFPPLRVLRAPTMIDGKLWSPQDFLDRHLPFASLYVKPLESPPRDLVPAERATISAQGVNRFREEIVLLYGLTFNLAPRPTEPMEAARYDKNPWYLEDSSTDLHLRASCPVRLLRLSQATIFNNWMDLPMPQDPQNVFLTGLLLIHSDAYRCDPSALLPLAPRPPRMQHEGATVFEVGSVLRVRGGDD